MKTLYAVVAAVVIGANAWAADPNIYLQGDRNPNETNVDLYIRSWKDSPAHSGHGGFIEQEYLTRGNPQNPTHPGAVLKYIKEYNHGILGPKDATRPVKHDTEQVFFFVLSGVGTAESGGKTAPLSEGTGVFIPAGITYKFTNTGNDALDVVIIVEEITEGFVPITEMKTGSYHDHIPSVGAHYCHIGYGIVDGAKYANPMGIGVVGITTFDYAHPHAHVEGAEEIWNQFRGNSLLIIGTRLRHQSEGTAFLAPPDGTSPHSSINHTGEPMYWLYVGNRHDRN